MLKPGDFVAGKQKVHIKMMSVGNSGSGKSYLAATFPKSYFAITEPAGEDTWLTQPELRKNVVGFDRFLPKSEEDTRRVFKELNDACDIAREMAQKGEIETFVLDNFTYLAENRWIYINKYEQQISAKTGEIDTRGMYGTLARWLYNFTLMKLLTLPCNLVLNFHEKLESDEVMIKKSTKDAPIIASCLGSFRDDVNGMFSLVLFLSKANIGGGKYKYFARTNLGQMKNAKSRFANIPEVLENISYNVIRKAVDDSIGIKGE